ncbi:TetR family transcriptional regulator [Hydrogenispora ethanolica]|uniref:TetR family transcriptional regulator n=1 Tax=Hydrogenispora ethanolica TaxID=1082276 RepID=A0A4R1R2Z3_HYDET|nr:TetR/AcrR family transcriptional regulator [Hydrogenispora ethanolica]TCL59773.1 TetR family transcriptional regulator [Hydrogenispora ethanolica]
MLERIKAAAIEEMIERGLKFTMSDLAARLAVSKRTLYEFFPSKEVLVETIIDDELNGAIQEHINIINATNLSFYQKFKLMQTFIPKILGRFNATSERRLVEDIRRYMPETWAKTKRAQEEQWKLFQEFLQEGINDGYIRPVNLAVVQKMISGALEEMLNERFLAENDMTISEVYAQLNEIIMVGMVNPNKIIQTAQL